MLTLAEPTLTSSDWQAVSIALKDATSGGCAATGKPGLVARLVTVMTGVEPQRPLADPRLEAIRSFVCATRRARRPTERFVPDLVAQGFSREQIDALALLSA